MSLTARQKEHTIAEFEQNRRTLELSYADIAAALNTTPEHVEAVAHLRGRSIEEPWILRNYLIEQADARNIELVPFTALAGDPRDYWFLDTAFIARGTLGNTQF